MKKFTAYILAVSFMFVLVPLLANATSTSASTSASNAKSTTIAKTKKSKPAVVAINMTAKDFEFDPSVINAHVGDTIKITLTGADAKHSFALSAFKVNVAVTPGQTKTFSFKATKKGTFTFRCGVPCGPGHRNMTGTVVVS